MLEMSDTEHAFVCSGGRTGRMYTESDMSSDDWRYLLKRRETNRRSAQKSRSKRLQHLNKARKTYHEALSINTDLRYRVQQLKRRKNHLQETWQWHMTSCHSPVDGCNQVKGDAAVIANFDSIVDSWPSSLTIGSDRSLSDAVPDCQSSVGSSATQQQRLPALTEITVGDDDRSNGSLAKVVASTRRRWHQPLRSVSFDVDLKLSTPSGKFPSIGASLSTSETAAAGTQSCSSSVDMRSLRRSKSDSSAPSECNRKTLIAGGSFIEWSQMPKCVLDVLMSEESETADPASSPTTRPTSEVECTDVHALNSTNAIARLDKSEYQQMNNDTLVTSVGHRSDAKKNISVIGHEDAHQMSHTEVKTEASFGDGILLYSTAEGNGFCEYSSHEGTDSLKSFGWNIMVSTPQQLTDNDWYWNEDAESSNCLAHFDREGLID